METGFFSRGKSENGSATLESERAIMRAESALVKARIRSEATQGLSDLEGEEPSLSGFDKGNKYVIELPDIQTRPTPEPAPVFTDSNREISAELPRQVESLAFRSPETVAQQDDIGIDSRQQLNPHSASWINPSSHLYSKEQSEIKHVSFHQASGSRYPVLSWFLESFVLF